ncbi:MAG: AAA family ATPase [Thermodesulfobacteriota bacterium]|nr:AAA family ATPase [Thermodesulfobacteriota bacterium]
MKPINEKNIPDPKKVEKEIGDFLHEKYGDNIKLVTPIRAAEYDETGGEPHETKKPDIQFDLKPEALVAYLDQFIIRQEDAKKILSTKICTHFNRIKHDTLWNGAAKMVGGIKNNVLMIGPTGVGKTYMIRLIARKLGVPFIKGDATKFSETGYVGGDVEDLVRDLVREADNDIERAQYGIVYIDEIDKIASSTNFVGADVSRSGVQRALLTLMEDTDVEMKVPHDPVSIMQEVEQFRKTGKREKRVVNTKNILFIMSGAFNGLQDIINKRLSRQSIGFSAQIQPLDADPYEAIKHIKSEDLATFGFEAEFVGRLPIRAVYETLGQKDLFDILKNPSNPIILSKKIDFAAYGIQIAFSDDALTALAENAYKEKTGARGLVNAVERALIHFESKLPSTDVTKFPVTKATVDNPEKDLERFLEPENRPAIEEEFDQTLRQEKAAIRHHISENCAGVAEKYDFSLTPERVDILAEFCMNRITDIDNAFKTVKAYYDEVKNIEQYFAGKYHLHIVLEEDAVYHILIRYIKDEFANFEKICNELSRNFVDGFRLLAEKGGQQRFHITEQALMFPESWLESQIKEVFGRRSSELAPHNINTFTHRNETDE